MRYEWDDDKNEINEKKHGISFSEATTVFDDAEALFINDPDHSVDEDRFLILGLSSKSNMLVVCHCYRGDDDIIRIISAREATKNETKQYYERYGGA